MKLQELLSKNRDTILADWEDVVLGEYAPETFRIFKKQKNKFANPIGHKTTTGLAELYDVLCDEDDKEIATPALVEMLKVRALQPISATEAMSFLFEIKTLVRERCEKQGMDKLYKEFLAFCVRVDATALAMFDIFTNCKHRVFMVRINELKTGRHIITDNAKCSAQLVRENMEEDK